MKFCKDCKHNDDMGRFGNWCNRPSGYTNVVTGKDCNLIRSARSERDSKPHVTNKCGVEAKFFEGTWFYNIKIKLFGE